MRLPFLLLALTAFLAQPTRSAEAGVICTLLADARTGAVLLEEGDCDRRATPASTFKVALAVMGYDSGILVNEASPVHAYRAGDPDWGGANWTRDTDPQRWMRYSVVWYSQRITRAMGMEQLARYVRAFDYGNADVTGDPGADNGLERAWLSSSLEITPREQVAFLRKLIGGVLPVSDRALEMARALVVGEDVGRWRVWGKTGGAYPRRADGGFDYAHGWGWFVGWAVAGERTVVFARLTQDERRQRGSPGIRARDAFLAEWPDIVARAGPPE